MQEEAVEDEGEEEAKGAGAAEVVEQGAIRRGPEFEVGAHAAEGEQEVASRVLQNEAEASLQQRSIHLGFVEALELSGNGRGIKLAEGRSMHGVLGGVHGVAGVGVEQEELAVDAVVAVGEGGDAGEEDEAGGDELCEWERARRGRANVRT